MVSSEGEQSKGFRGVCGNARETVVSSIRVECARALTMARAQRRGILDVREERLVYP